MSGILSLSVQGYKYYLLVIDDATRLVWVRFAKSKNTATIFPLLIKIIVKIKAKTDNAVLEVQCDRGKGEYSQTFKLKYKKLDITVEQSPEYKHSLNRVAERYMGLIKTKMRSMLYKARLPYEFWNYAVEYSVWLKNRMPTEALSIPNTVGKLAQAITLYKA